MTQLTNFNNDQINALADGATAVILTPDDILTLRLMRDQWQSHRQRYPDEKHRSLNDELELDTLNRILKQVE